MKLKKFNENFQNINVFDEYKVILTDEFDIHFNFGIAKKEKNNVFIRDITYKSEYDFLTIQVYPTTSQKIETDHFIKKINELNSHLISEDWIFEGYYQSNGNQLLKDNLDTDIIYSIYLLYKIPKESHLCVDCKFLCTEDVGYSNYTVTSTEIHCLKNLWNNSIATAISCESFKNNTDNQYYIHINVDDELKDCLYDSMDIDVVEAFKKYNNFEQHSWGN